MRKAIRKQSSQEIFIFSLSPFMYVNKNNRRSWPGMLAESRVAGACFCSGFVEKLSDSPRGRLGCSGTAEGRCISPHSSLGAFTLGCSSRRPSKHTVMAQPWCSLLGDLLAQRWVPVGTGLGDHNEEGSSRMGFHELTGEVLDLQLLRCSPCLGAVLIASSSSAGVESHRWRLTGGQILMDLGSAARLPTA